MLKGINNQTLSFHKTVPQTGDQQSPSNEACSNRSLPSVKRLAIITLGAMGLCKGVQAFVPAINPVQARSDQPNDLQPAPRDIWGARLGLAMINQDRLRGIEPGYAAARGRLSSASLSLAQGGSLEPAAAASRSEKPKNRIIRVETIEAFKHQVIEEQNRLVAVKFFSPTCRACQAMAAYYKKLAIKYPDVKFVEVPWTSNNALLLQGLGVYSFPFGHLYHPDAGLVETMSLNRKRIGDFETKLGEYLAGECQLKEDDLTR